MADEEEHAAAGGERAAHVGEVPVEADAELDERLHDERAFPRARVRQRERGRVAHKAAEVDEVDVDRARAVPHRPHAPERVLDRVHARGEILRRKVGLEAGGLVEELQVREFRRHADGLGLAHAARGDEARAREGRERGEGLREVRLAGTGVGAERDDRAHHARPFCAATRPAAPYIRRSFGFSILPVGLRGTSAKMILRGRL